MEEEKKYIIHRNYDTQPKLLGIFDYKTIIISLAIVIPIVYIIFKLNISLETKIYATFLTIFPIFLLNIIFARVSHLHLLIYYAIRYYLSDKIYVYSKNDKITKY